MSLFDIFRKQQSSDAETFDMAEIVQAMFNEASITPHHHGNMFMTEIDGVHCTFKTVLKCDEENPHKLFIYAPFSIPVPKHVAGLMTHELNRLNGGDRKAEITMQENNGEFSIFAFTDCEFDKAPTTAEVQNLMIHNIDLLDNGNFRSLACAILGYATYEELERAMLDNAKVEGNNATIQMADGYCALHDRSNGVTSPRYAGRLLMLSTHIIESRISQERSRQLLTEQIPLLMIMQEAYNVADDAERDVLRKLRYLSLYTKTDSDNDNDSMLGRLEATSVIEKDKYLLLNGLEQSIECF